MCGKLNECGLTVSSISAQVNKDAAHARWEAGCDWYGRDFVKVSRWFPSSKTCGHCGYVFSGLARSMRDWTCPECGAHLDRDLNAARNIAKEGKRLLEDQSQATEKEDTC